MLARNIVCRASKKGVQARVSFDPRTAKQQDLVHMLHDGPPIVVVAGSAGSGKTVCATSVGLAKLLNGDVSKMVVARPALFPPGEDLGFLPGDLNAKTMPWCAPVLDCLAHYLTPAELKSMIGDGKIELCALSYVRGRTFENSWMILDEAQNARRGALVSFMTRIGRGSRLVVTGDTEQSDLGPSNGLLDLLTQLDARAPLDPRAFGVVEFEDGDIVRHDVIEKVLALYRQ